MALSTTLLHFEDITVTVKDGTATTPLSVVCNLDTGDFSLSGLAAILREVVAYERKGKLQTLRHGVRTYPTGSFTMQFAEWSEASSGTLYDMIHGTAATPYAARVSTTSSGVMTFDIVIANEGTDYGGADSTLTLEDCYITWDWSKGEPDTCSISFTVYGDITGDLAIAED